MPILATDGRGIDLYTGSVSKMQTAVRHAMKSATEIRRREILSHFESESLWERSWQCFGKR